MFRKKAENTVVDLEPELFDTGLEVCEKLVVLIPYEILGMCATLQDKMEHSEFSVLVKSEWTKDGYELKNEFVVPKQSVNSVEVNYKEDLEQYKSQGFNTVIHSHPFVSSNFSGADDDSINVHFECSLLFSIDTFRKAVLSFSGNLDVRLVLDASITYIASPVEVPVAELEKIEKEIYASTYEQYKPYQYNYKEWQGYSPSPHEQKSFPTSEKMLDKDLERCTLPQLEKKLEEYTKKGWKIIDDSDTYYAYLIGKNKQKLLVYFNEVYNRVITESISGHYIGDAATLLESRTNFTGKKA